MADPRQLGLWERWRSYVFFNPLIYLYTGVLGTLSLLSSFFDPEGRIQHGFARLWSRMILATSRCTLQVEGLGNVDPSRSCIYASNHQSALDIPTLYVGLPVQFRIMAKKELFRYPFMGWHLSRSGQIPIERENARSSLKSLNRASESLRNGTPLFVFPEGGRTPDGLIKPFLGGAFYVAIKAGAPIVPMALVGTYEALPMNAYVIRPHPIRLIIGEPMSTEGLRPRDMDVLAAKVQRKIEDLYYSHACVSDPRVTPEGAEIANSE
ncbi:MAG: lysophospholipid acyltransferase family protein [Acidobacteriaceae bacterium]